VVDSCRIVDVCRTYDPFWYTMTISPEGEIKIAP